MTITLFQRSTSTHTCAGAPSGINRDATDVAGTSAVTQNQNIAAGTSNDPRMSWTSDAIGNDTSADWDGLWGAAVEITDIGGSLSVRGAWRRVTSACGVEDGMFQSQSDLASTGLHNISNTGSLSTGLSSHASATDRVQLLMQVSNSHMMNAEGMTWRFNLSDHTIATPIPAGGPGVVELSGTSTTQSLGSGTLERTREVAGTSTTQTSGTGTLSRARPLVGTSTALTSGSGEVAVERTVTGTSTTSTSGSGSLDVGAAPVEFSGTSITQSSGAGSLATTRSFAGTSIISTSGVGNFNATRTLAGTSTTLTSGSGALDISSVSVVELSGTSTTLTSGVGEVGVEREFAGTSSTTTSSSGSLLRTAGLAGISTTLTSGLGSLDVTSPVVVSFTGTSTTLATSTGLLDAFRSLAGSSTTHTLGSGTLLVTVPHRHFPLPTSPSHLHIPLVPPHLHPPPVIFIYLITEDGDRLLTESGDYILAGPPLHTHPHIPHSHPHTRAPSTPSHTHS